jgi:hypothetical protein
MTRIFLSLSIAATGTLLVALWLGLNIGDAAEVTTAAQNRVATHFLTALGALMFAVLVHAIVLTYFMGTSRWLEETSNAYRLGSGWQQQSKDLKWKLYPAMVVALTMLILTGFGRRFSRVGTVLRRAHPPGICGAHRARQRHGQRLGIRGTAPQRAPGTGRAPAGAAHSHGTGPGRVNRRTRTGRICGFP